MLVTHASARRILVTSHPYKRPPRQHARLPECTTSKRERVLRKLAIYETQQAINAIPVVPHINRYVGERLPTVAASVTALACATQVPFLGLVAGANPFAAAAFGLTATAAGGLLGHVLTCRAQQTILHAWRSREKALQAELSRIDQDSRGP